MLTRILLFSAAAAASVLGVAPKEQHLYLPDTNGQWHCLLDPSIVLRPDQINDGYCDCPDGSDEPATHACPYPEEQPLYFYCENKGYVPRLIERHKLNDGVCDYDFCCDGSDEWEAGNCPGKCDLVQRQYEQHIQSFKEKVSGALEVREQYVQKGRAAKHALEAKLGALHQEATAANKLVAELQQKLRQVELKTGAAAEQGSDDASEYGQKIQQTLDAYKQQAEQHKQQLLQLQSMVADLAANYNPNFNDPAVKKCVKLYGDFVSNKADENAVPELQVDQVLGEIALAAARRETPAFNVAPTLSNVWHYYYSRIIGIVAPKPEPQRDSARRPGTKEVAELKKDVKKAEKAALSAEATISVLQSRLAQVYGDEDVLRGLEGEWILQDLGEYTYKIGLLDAVYQDKTLVGRFSHIDGNTVQFSGGNKCWNGPQRSARVDMVCGAANKIVSVSEPEKCQYRILLETPLVCKDMSEAEIAASFVVDLARL